MYPVQQRGIRDCTGNGVRVRMPVTDNIYWLGCRGDDTAITARQPGRSCYYRRWLRGPGRRLRRLGTSGNQYGR